jgi:hypothetical protein
MQGRKKQRARKNEIPPRDTLTEQQRKEIEEAFDILDTDGSGDLCSSFSSCELECFATKTAKIGLLSRADLALITIVEWNDLISRF